MKILYVEDHADTAHLVGLFLRQAGHEVATAHSCEEARAVLQSTPVEFLISDLTLPDGDGCALMREIAAGYKIPGLALSGHAGQQHIDAAKSAGFADLLVKPLEFPALLLAIDRVKAFAT